MSHRLGRNYLKFPRVKSRFSRVTAVLFILLFAAIGTKLIFFSHADTLVGDLNGDGVVNVFDLSIFLTHYGETGPNLPEDFNHDGAVNIFDLSMLLANYGKALNSAPSITFTANPTSVTAGSSTTLSWSSTGATSCSASGAWSGSEPTVGTYNTPALSAATTYYLSCAGSGGTLQSSVSVSINASTGATINATPDGVPNPSGDTWSLVYGDAFNDPLGSGTGQDNTLYPVAGGADSSDSCSANQPGFNSDEMEVFNCSQAVVNSSGLNLNCNYTPGVTTDISPSSDPNENPDTNYTCGAASGNTNAVSGYKFFEFKPNDGNDFAVEINAKLPPDSGEADPGWWSYASKSGGGSEEIDYFEGFGWGNAADSNWTTSGVNMSDPNLIGDEGCYSDTNNLGFDPSTSYNTYTTVLDGNGDVAEYINGKLIAWDFTDDGGASSVCGPMSANFNTLLPLILSYAMRNIEDGNSDPYFQSGTRDFAVRSVAVYENNAAQGADTENSGLAPGTTAPGATVY